MSDRAARQILAIDLLRCLCALSVAAYHFYTVFPLCSSPASAYVDRHTLPAGASRWTWCGWVGVELFFVISGYVIARSAVGSTRAMFLRRRALRLVPAAWICATLTALAVAIGRAIPIDATIVQWATSVSFAPVGARIDPCYWTLAVESVFYLAVAAVIGRDGKSAEAKIERLGRILGLAGLGYWVALPSGLIAGLPVSDAWLNLTLLPHGAFFALGIALVSWANRGVSIMRLLDVAIPLAAALAEISHQAQLRVEMVGAIANVLEPIAVFIIGLAIILGAQRLQHGLATIVGVRPLTVMGLATYPLYLLNQVFGAAMIGAAMHLPLSPTGATLVAFATVIVVAVMVSVWLEPRFREWLDRNTTAGISLRHDLAPDTRRSASLRAG